MKKDCRILILFVIAVFSFVSCRDILRDNENQKIQIEFSYDIKDVDGNSLKDSTNASVVTNARTITPESAGDGNIYCFVIYAASYDEYGNVGDFYELKTINYWNTWDRTLYLEKGKYDFISYAYNYNSEDFLKATLTDVDVYNGMNRINFNFAPINEGEGTIYLSCRGMEYGYAKIYLDDEDVTSYITQWDYEEDGYAHYNGWTNFYLSYQTSSGDHSVTVEFYDISRILVKRTYDIVKVRKNMYSSATIYYYYNNSLNSMNVSFSEMPVCNGDVSNPTTDTVTLKWNSEGSTIEGYQLQYYDMSAEDNYGRAIWTTIDSNISYTTTSYIHTNAKRGHTYRYRIRAFNKGNYSD